MHSWSDFDRLTNPGNCFRLPPFVDSVSRCRSRETKSLRNVFVALFKFRDEMIDLLACSWVVTVNRKTSDLPKKTPLCGGLLFIPLNRYLFGLGVWMKILSLKLWSAEKSSFYNIWFVWQCFFLYKTYTSVWIGHRILHMKDMTVSTVLASYFFYLWSLFSKEKGRRRRRRHGRSPGLGDWLSFLVRELVPLSWPSLELVADIWKRNTGARAGIHAALSLILHPDM